MVIFRGGVVMSKILFSVMLVVVSTIAFAADNTTIEQPQAISQEPTQVQGQAQSQAPVIEWNAKEKEQVATAGAQQAQSGIQVDSQTQPKAKVIEWNIKGSEKGVPSQQTQGAATQVQSQAPVIEWNAKEKEQHTSGQTQQAQPTTGSDVKSQKL